VTIGTGYYGEGYFGGTDLSYIIPSSPAPGLPSSYTTNQIYSAMPQFVQDQDAALGYPFYYYLYGVCQSLDKLDNLMFDNVGAGITVMPTSISGTQITPGKISLPVAISDYVINVFNTDSTWNQINTTSNFTVRIENEIILVSGGAYNWTLPSLQLYVVQRGYENTSAAIHAASSGANGTTDLVNYAGAVGWSQILDINRCPSYALPWLAQFIGSGIPQNTTLTYQQMIQKMQARSGFQRATVSSIIAEMVAVINAQSGSMSPISAAQIIVLENTGVLASRGANLNAAIATTGATSMVLTNTDSSWGDLGSNGSFVVQIDGEKILVPQGLYNWLSAPVTITGITRGYGGTGAATHTVGTQVTLAGGNDIYGFNEYAMTILIPSSYYDLYTYTGLVAAAGGAGTYTAVNTFIGTLGGIYGDLSGSSLPSSSSNFVNFLYRYRPAGLQCFVGGY
jgi:hypothetical protein